MRTSAKGIVVVDLKEIYSQLGMDDNRPQEWRQRLHDHPFRTVLVTVCSAGTL